MRDVYIIGIGMTRFSRWLDRSVKDLTRESVDEALANAGIEKKDLKAAWFANSTWGFLQGQDQIRGQVALHAMGIYRIPISNIEGACAGGAQAFHNAWLGVTSGVYECTLAVGTEKLYDTDKKRSFRALETGRDTENPQEMDNAWISRLKKHGIEIPAEDFLNAGVDRGGMMNFYAAMIRWHMEKYGTTQRQLAIIASKAHQFGSLNPKAQFQEPMTLEDVLAAREVVYPLTVPMCAPLGDGSAAAILCSADFMKRMKSPKPVKILASVFGSSTPRYFDEVDKGIEIGLSQKAYSIAGIEPKDIDVLEVHDAASYGELKMVEQLGFCKPGEGGPFVESGETMLGGKLPVNVSGGLISRGHPLAATGLAQIHELVTQLRGEAGKRQVEGARIGMCENGGGQVYFEEASMGINILERMFR